MKNAPQSPDWCLHVAYFVQPTVQNPKILTEKQEILTCKKKLHSGW